MATEDRLLWLDVETTGLTPEDNALLEVAAFVTDADLNLLDEDGYHAVVKHDHPGHIAALANEYVYDMHSKTGLWDKLATGTPLGRIELDLLTYVKEFAPEHRQARLAGNSVRLDANFLDFNTPRVMAHLHYRLLDVSSIAFEAYHWRNVPAFPKKATHEALSDIKESIAELRYIRTELGY